MTERANRQAAESARRTRKPPRGLLDCSWAGALGGGSFPLSDGNGALLDLAQWIRGSPRGSSPAPVRGDATAPLFVLRAHLLGASKGRGRGRGHAPWVLPRVAGSAEWGESGSKGVGPGMGAESRRALVHAGRCGAAPHSERTGAAGASGKASFRPKPIICEARGAPSAFSRPRPC